MNRHIIITGANNGIGLTMTQSLLEMGDCVAALDLEVDNIAHTHPGLLPFRCDVTNPQRIQTVVDEIFSQWGKVDVLINNACLALFIPFEERSLDDIRREFEVNYFGYLNMIRAVLPIMKKQGRGVVHNFSSGVGFTGMPGMTGYTSTKGAVESLTRTLALEYASLGITFNVIHPPLTRTKSSSGLGIPPEMMADPAIVGRKLARQVGKTNPVLTPDFSNQFQLWVSYHFRVQMGKLLAMMTERAKNTKSS
ncbi:MAG: SDR family oxidoreductase [Anaerolineales bacterium]|nr:SDR family oxidoreductase [Anaerolineales bacterium]